MSDKVAATFHGAGADKEEETDLWTMYVRAVCRAEAHLVQMDALRATGATMIREAKVAIGSDLTLQQLEDAASGHLQIAEQWSRLALALKPPA